MIRFIAATRNAVITLAIVAGGPLLLTATMGPPIPHSWPSTDQVRAWLDAPFDRTYAAGTARVFVWLLWLLVTAVIAAVLVAQIGRLRWPTLAARLPRPAQSLAAALLGTAAITTTMTGTATSAAMAATPNNTTTPEPHTAAAVPEPALAADTSVTETPALTAGHPGAPATTATAVEQNANATVPTAARLVPGGAHRVVKGDTLWDIADHDLHDPQRWPEIYQLNRTKPQPDGHTLHNPDQIRIGWMLDLPGPHHTPPGTPSTSNGSPEPATPPAPSGSASTAAPTTAPSTSSTIIPARPGTPSPTTPTRASEPGTPRPPVTPTPEHFHSGHGVTLPSRGWVSLGLATTIASVATLLRLYHRRHARLRFPIAVRTGPTPPPVPDTLRPADAAGSRVLVARTNGPLPDLLPVPPRVPAPIGVDDNGTDISLFEIPGPAVLLDGPGAPAAARAISAAVLATDVADHLPTRPVLIIPADTLTRLLPDGSIPHGLDPNQETFDEERLIVVPDTGAAVTHLETEMISRRRLLDEMGADTVDELNARTDHVEYLAPYVLLIPAETRYTARILAVAAHRQALQLHPVLLGALPDTFDVTRLDIAAGGAFIVAPAHSQAGGPLPGEGRLAVLAARDLADLLGMIAAAAPRPETGDRSSEPTSEPARSERDVDLAEIPQTAERTVPAPVRLTVLGPPTLATADGPITTGIRQGSLAVLAVLAAHPRGRTYEQLAADLHPDTDAETGINRVRTDLNAVRSLLREATGIPGRGKFILHDNPTGRYRIDPNLIEVDLWTMLNAIDRANHVGDDEPACLAALREAVACYRGDFADGQDRAWITDYATAYRHQLLSAYARIAEILETDQPDQAIAALDAAIDHDPVNEELYQRLMRIHGRLDRPDAVRRTLRLLENRLAELGESEPSEATCRVAARQLKPTLTSLR